MLHSQEATESCKKFIEDLNEGRIELDREPMIDGEFDTSAAALQARFEDYSNFLKSDLCKEIFKICDETDVYLGDESL